MAVKRYTIQGFGQLELNQFAAPRDGRIEAQCELDNTEFNTGNEANKPFCENGMVLAIDKANRKIKLPSTDGGAANEVYALNYSTEHLYDDREQALRFHALHAKPDNAVNETIGFGAQTKVKMVRPGYDFLPRMGFFAVGDRFTTNTLAYDTTEFADDDAVDAALADCDTTPVYAVPCTNGAWLLTATAGSYLTAQVVKDYEMPDGQHGVKLFIVKA